MCLGNLSRATRCMKEPQMGLDKRRSSARAYRRLRSQILMLNSLMRRATKKPQSRRAASLADCPLTLPLTLGQPEESNHFGAP
ncbi:MAG: hypothetical protein ACI814_001290 [Mariniblastus sp.]|jgi:hypothetical protein